MTAPESVVCREPGHKPVRHQVTRMMAGEQERGEA